MRAVWWSVQTTAWNGSNSVFSFVEGFAGYAAQSLGLDAQPVEGNSPRAIDADAERGVVQTEQGAVDGIELAQIEVGQGHVDFPVAGALLRVVGILRQDRSRTMAG